MILTYSFSNYVTISFPGNLTIILAFHLGDELSILEESETSRERQFNLLIKVRQLFSKVSHLILSLVDEIICSLRNHENCKSQMVFCLVYVSNCLSKH